MAAESKQQRAERVRRYIHDRRVMGWSTRRIGEKLGVSPAAVTAIEAGVGREATVLLCLYNIGAAA